MLITIRNSLISKKAVCKVKAKSINNCFNILRLLYNEGYILSYIYNRDENIIYITHNYIGNIPSISILKVYNKASFPLYIKYRDLAAIHKFGVDLLILSTPCGIMPHYEALKRHLGGKAICYIR